MEIKPRIFETDLLGHIHHSNYFVYMEEARLEFLKNIGVDINFEKFTFVLVSTNCDFIRRGVIGQVIESQTQVEKIGDTSLTLSCSMIEKNSGNLIAQGEATMVYFDIVNQKSTNIPDSIKAKLES